MALSGSGEDQVARPSTVRRRDVVATILLALLVLFLVYVIAIMVGLTAPPSWFTTGLGWRING